MKERQRKRHELLQRIRDNPRDAVAREEYATWLESHGRKKEAKLQRIKASQCSRFNPDYDYRVMGKAAFPEGDFSDTAIEMIANGEILKWEDQYYDPVEVQSYYANTLLKNDLLLCVQPAPVPTQEILQRVWYFSVDAGEEKKKIGSDEGEVITTIGNDGYGILLDEEGYYTLLTPEQMKKATT